MQMSIASFYWVRTTFTKKISLIFPRFLIVFLTNSMKIYIFSLIILNYYVFSRDFGSTKFQNQMLNHADKDDDITKEAFLFN